MTIIETSQATVKQPVNTPEKVAAGDSGDELQVLLAKFALKLEEQKEEEVDFSEDPEAIAWIDRIRELDSEKLPAEDPKFPYFFRKEKKTNLSLNPTWSLLDAMSKSCDKKSAGIFGHIQKNNALLEESSKLTNFSARLRSEEKDNKGIDFSQDEEAKKLIQSIYDKYPDIFGKVEVDEKKQIKNFKFSHAQVEGVKMAAGEQVQILLSRQQVNRAYTENDMKELVHLWELMNHSVKEYNHALEHINRKMGNAQ